ncbi:menaquinone biosynthesis decarboxylase, partial [Candidatus Sumerlaeota bacterium]|nr:menaquinone biosynthesis decarboxylase [Candidatus Sumerlaeota bacterium]
MRFENLRDFISYLENHGELRRIRVPVSPRLEMTEIADRTVKRGGPALLFENPTGYNIPVLMNAMGSRRRISMALGSETISDIIENYLALLDQAEPLTFFDKLKLLPRLKEVSDALPSVVDSGPCQEVVLDPPSFEPFPILTCWPGDGGPYLTFPLVFTHDPETSRSNCGIYRMQIYDPRTSGMHWHVHKGGAQHYRKAEARGQRLPVSVAVGCDPVVVFAAACPLPADADEMLLAGLIRGRGVRMVKSLTNDILVPAEAEIVFEGYVEPHERRREGPFGDHTGFYSLPDDFPVFHLACVTHRRNPIYHATVVGRPPMEDCFIGEAIERLFLPILGRLLPEVVDVHMPFVGVFHNLLLVSIRKGYAGHARKVMHALWGLGQMMTTKVIVVVDEDVNIHDAEETVWKALNHIDPQRDLEFVLGPVDTLDHASRLPNFGSKVGIDATRKWPE